ncbi:MAG: hypothetical protein Kow0031_40510 [Anaerolineae bacterium]
MTTQPIHLTPEEVEILIQCPLHYHFRRQEAGPPDDAAELEQLVRESAHDLHAQGGPGRVSLRRCLAPLQHHLAAQVLVERYYLGLRHDWASTIASNEALALTITIARVAIQLHTTVDRLNSTGDGGIVAVLIRTGAEAPADEARHRNSPRFTIYHALVASAYLHKRPVRIREMWLAAGRDITIELSEAEYRDNLSRLREPVLGLSRGQVRARPGLHCDSCPYKPAGCPVYAHHNSPDDFDSPPPDGKIQPRQWLFDV